MAGRILKCRVNVQMKDEMGAMRRWVAEAERTERSQMLKSLLETF